MDRKTVKIDDIIGVSDEFDDYGNFYCDDSEEIKEHEEFGNEQKNEFIYDDCHEPKERDYYTECCHICEQDNDCDCKIDFDMSVQCNNHCDNEDWDCSEKEETECRNYDCKKEYRKGYKCGYRDGYESAKREVEEFIRRKNKCRSKCRK